MEDVESLEETASQNTMYVIVLGQPRYVRAELSGGVPMMSTSSEKLVYWNCECSGFPKV